MSKAIANWLDLHLIDWEYNAAKKYSVKIQLIRDSTLRLSM